MRSKRTTSSALRSSAKDSKWASIVSVLGIRVCTMDDHA